MEMQLDHCVVRSWRPEDASSLARHANDREIWRNLRDRFPHPYTLEDAERFILSSLSQQPEDRFAIAVDGEAVGGIGLMVGTDVERISAEIGYWLGRSFWGRGIVTEALQAVTRYAVQTLSLTRVFALPFAHNPASTRVLEKSGYQLEGRLRRAALKEGRIVDQLLYAYVVPEPDPPPPT
jgi:RimJ/RimL family protein N-acetyltransferase